VLGEAVGETVGETVGESLGASDGAPGVEQVEPAATIVAELSLALQLLLLRLYFFGSPSTQRNLVFSEQPAGSNPKSASALSHLASSYTFMRTTSSSQ
jgi:hypothetical protein